MPDMTVAQPARVVALADVPADGRGHRPGTGTTSARIVR